MAALADRSVSRIALGGARWSIAEPYSLERVCEIIDFACGEGTATYLDTARAYTAVAEEAHNETIIARALDRLGLRDGVIVGTKGGHFRGPDGWGIDASPDALRRDCEASLRALGVDAIDLYFLHHPDPQVPIAESVGALAQLRDDGAVRAIGVCNVTIEQLGAARDESSIDAVQNPFSPYGGDRAVLELCTAESIPFLAYSPLGGARRPAPLIDISATARRIATERGESIETVMLAWLLAQSPTLIALTGASRPQSLASSMRAARLKLAADDVAAIEHDLNESVTTT